MSNQDISDEHLNAFVDNQLEPADKIQIFDAINQNETLKRRVCELRNLKEMIQQAYKQAPAYKQNHYAKTHTSRNYWQALAACLLLLAGGTSGWFAHTWSNNGGGYETTALQQSAISDNVTAEARNIIVHLNRSGPIRFRAALDETESLLKTYKQGNRPIEIELITNQRGADLLRADLTNYKERIELMHAKYPNLKFMVCGQTLAKLKNKGESVKLLPHTKIASSAVTQINKRLNQGWGYIKI